MTKALHYLVTGGTGFFGRALLRHWITAEYAGQVVPQVTLLSRNPAVFSTRYPQLTQRPWLRLIQGDVCDRPSLPHGSAFTHVLHAATDSTLGPELAPLQRYDQIVNGTRNMLDLAVACSAERFLLTSSGGVYGVQPVTMTHLPEDWHGIPDPLLPSSAYSAAKRSAEHLCALYGHASGLHVVVARCFAFVGPDLPLDVHFAIGNFIRDALYGEAITVQGDGSQVRSYMDQEDLAHWLLTILERGSAGQAYNVGSDQAISVAELAHLVRDLVAPSIPIQIKKRDLGGARNRYVPSIAKAREELGLRVNVPLALAIQRSANAHRGGLRNVH